MAVQVDLQRLLTGICVPLKGHIQEFRSRAQCKDTGAAFGAELIAEDIREDGGEKDLSTSDLRTQEYFKTQSRAYAGLFEALDPLMGDFETVLMLYRQRPDLFEDLDRKLEPDVVRGLKHLFKVVTCDPTVLPEDSDSNAYCVWKRLSRDRVTFNRLLDLFTRLESRLDQS